MDRVIGKKTSKSVRWVGMNSSNLSRKQTNRNQGGVKNSNNMLDRDGGNQGREEF